MTRWKTIAAIAGAEYVLAAAGDRIGEIFFDDRTPFGGVASHEATDWAKTSVPVVTLDSLVEERKLPGPFLVKLDTPDSKFRS